jgi:hypothetical protein
MSFLIDFWPLNTIPLDFWQKIQDGGSIRVVLKTLFLRQKNKNLFLPRFVVINSTKILWKRFFENLLKWQHSPR